MGTVKASSTRKRIIMTRGVRQRLEMKKRIVYFVFLNNTISFFLFFSFQKGMPSNRNRSTSSFSREFQRILYQQSGKLCVTRCEY